MQFPCKSTFRGQPRFVSGQSAEDWMEGRAYRQTIGSNETSVECGHIRGIRLQNEAGKAQKGLTR